MAKKKPSFYSVGLGSKILIRAQVIFLVVVVLVVATTGYAAYTDIKSGKLQKNIVEPVKSFFKSLQNKESTISGTPFLQYNIKVDSNIDTKTETTPTPKPQVKQNYQYQTPTYATSTTAPTTTTSTETYEQAEWSKQQQQSNQNWFTEQSAKNDAAAKTWYDQQVQQSQQSLEEWKKAHGF